MAAYRQTWGLSKQKGFTVETAKPLGLPARKLLLRIQKNIVARKLMKKRWANGILNAPTRNILIPPLTPGERAVAYALTQVGVHESPWGSNRGEDVHRYQSSTDNYNVAWCASFVWYCWQRAGYRGPVSAGAWYTTDRIGNPVDIDNAKRGDNVSFDTGDGHVGLYLSHNRTHVKTVDGNTNDQVAIRERPISLIHRISRPVMR